MDAENTQSGFPSSTPMNSSAGTSGTSGIGATGTGTSGIGTSGSGTSGMGASGSADMSGNSGNAEGIAGMARNFASQAQQKAGEQVRSSLDKGRSRAVDTLQEVARTLRNANDGSDNPTGQYMGKAGDQVDRFASFLQNTDPKQMLTQTEAFARRQPALFLGGAFALGVIAARFLKSGSKDTDQFEGGYGGSMSTTGRFTDRERSLSSYREPSGYTADSPMGNDMIGDDSDWPNTSAGMSNTTGMEDDSFGSSTDLGPTSRR